MAKQITFDKDLHDVILRAVTTVEKSVKATLGPAGRFVLLEQPYGGPKMTKDGVSVAKAIELKDPIENAIASFFKTAASHTVDQAGDGTSTSIVLAASIFKSALKAVAVGANAVHIKSGIEEAAKLAVESLNDLKVVITNDFEKIKQVAVVSANGDAEVGSLITDAFKKVGENGVINVEEGKTREHELKVVEGMQFDRGYISPYFATNTEKMVCEMENPLIFIYDKKITSAQSVVPILKLAHESGRGLLIIAEDIEGEAVSTMVLNKLRGVLQVVAVKAPGFGERRKEICQDIGILTGATVISEEIGYKIENVAIEHMGRARKIVITANETTIIEGAGEVSSVDSRVLQIKSQISNASSEYDKEKLQERLAKLTGGIAILKVGGATEEAAKECKDRFDDAVQAVKAAIEEGIVPGGTVSLLYAKSKLEKAMEKLVADDKKIGYEAVLKSLEAPLEAILENAGRKDAAVVFSEIRKAQANNNNSFGLDVRNNKFGNMIEMGVIDPVKVVRCALENASSIASMLVVSNVAITNMPKDEKDMPGMPGGMPGMGY
jgi:chaperonin GroEL